MDLGIISYGAHEKESLENTLKSNNIFIQTLSHEAFYLVASADSVWAQLPSVSYKALATVSMATFSDILKYDAFPSTIDLQYSHNPTVYLPSKESLLKTLISDDSLITIFPRIGAVTDSAVRSGALVAIPIFDFPNTQYISLLFHADHAISPFAQAFIEIFTTHYKNF